MHSSQRQRSQQHQLLFTPGARLGWTFRDRRELAVPYPEPAPPRQVIQGHAAARTAAADAAWRRAWNWAGKPSIGLALILIGLAGCARSVSHNSFNFGLTALAVIVLCGPGLGYAGWRWLQHDKARDVGPDEEYQQATAAWRQRAARHESAELARLADQPEWGSVNAPSRRVEVFGGSLAGWRSLLAVHGTSLLADQHLLVADLSGQHATSLLSATAQDAQISEVTYRLPQDLGRSELLRELPADQFVDAVAEAMHAGTPGGARIDRAIDVRVMRQIAGAIAERGATPQRLAAAIRTVLGLAPAAGPLNRGPRTGLLSGSLLTVEEQELLSGVLFPPQYRDQVATSLGRSEAIISELATHLGDGWPAQPARCTCLVMDSGARGAHGEVLAALIVQWLTVRVSSAEAAPPAVIVVGADEITRTHLERLAAACELRGVPLTLLFRHLRDDAASLLGGGTAAFLRLGPHAEAGQAARYLGRHHTFVTSAWSTTRSRTRTAPSGGGTGAGDGAPGSWSQTDSWQQQTTRERVREWRVDPSALQNLPEFTMLLADRATNSLRMRAVEFDLAISTLPGVSSEPLPPANATRPRETSGVTVSGEIPEVPAR
jgi:hypothetical protein